MNDINEILAKQIVDKLKEENLISGTNTQLVEKLSNGTLKDTDWKIALEETINKPIANTENKDET